MLNKQVTVIVPSKTKTNKPLNLEKNLKECLEKMGYLFGGATASSEQLGCYLMKSGEMMIEKSISITAYCKASHDLTNFFIFIKEIKEKYNQECIAIIMNNEMQFI